MAGLGGAPSQPGDTLAEILRPQRLTAIVDIGANPIDADPPYKAMLSRRLCRVVGFEPQPEALATLLARKSDLETYLPDVVGDGSDATLRVCKSPGMTGLLEPNPGVLRFFGGFPDWGTVVKEVPVATRRLDDIGEVESLDFLKIDTQGSELSIFQGGRERLGKAIAVQTEVSFIPLYKNQPVFGDIDLELRRAGLIPHMFAAINKRMILPLYDPNNPYAAVNQVIEADVVYVRDFMRADGMDDEQLKHLAMVAHHCYGSYDLAVNCIHRLIEKGAVPAQAVERYLGSLRKSEPQSAGGQARQP